MKLILILLTATLLQVSAATYAQKVTLKVKNATIKEVFEQIQHQTQYDFLYNADDLKLARPLSVNLKNTPLKQALDECFSGQPLSYSIQNTTILITRKPQTAANEAQKITITGTVTDTLGQPLPGVTVKEKGTQNAVGTDNTGRYSITVADNGAVLVFSYIGFVSQQRAVGTDTEINVRLTAETSVLEEVVAIGYGTAKKSDLTSSIASVKGEDLRNNKIGSAADALQGLAAGVNVNRNSYKPGGSSNISIRGIGSFGSGGASNTPLYVVDGVVSNAGLDFIAPNDIASIEVLKDAVSTAIYGSRGSNGVILVTTKRGKAGKTEIIFNANLGFQELANRQDVVNAAQYRELVDAGSQGTFLWDAEEDKMQEAGLSTDWQKEVTQRGIYQNYNLGVTTGTEKATHFIGLDWVDQKGIIKFTGFKRANVRYNSDTRLKDWLKLTVRFNVNRSATNSSNTDGVAGMNSLDQGTIGSAVASKPTAPVFNSDGTYYDNLLLRPNPLAAVTYFKNSFNQTRIIGSVGLEVDIVKGLKFRTENGAEIIENISNVFQDSRMTGIYKNANIANRSNGEQLVMQSENTLTYSLQTGKHNISAIGGFSLNTFNYDITSSEVINASNITQGYNLGSGTPRVVNSSRVGSALASFYSRVNYGFDEKYLATVTVRADGSSKFADGHKWGFFPSMGLAWRINQEEFLKDSRVVDNLKLRGSYGIVGNQEINPYQSMAQVDASSNTYLNYVLGGLVAAGSRTSNLAQPDLTWEKSKQVDIGLEFGLFNSRLSGSVEVYQKNTYDLLYNVPLPMESGYPTALVNVGSIRNRGIEVVLTSINITITDFTWRTGFNISRNKNSITALYNGLDRVGNLFVGQPLDVIFTKRWGGIWQQNEAQIASVYGRQPGDFKIVDLNGNSIIDDGDRTFVGQTVPQFFGGLSNNFKYKAFDLNVFITYAAGHLINNPFAYLNTYTASGNMSVDYYNNYWTPERSSNEYPRLASANSPLYETEGIWQKGDYIRLKNVEIGYTLPAAIAQKLSIAGVRIFASGENLHTFTKYTGFDVETANANPYPAARAFIAGLSVKF